MGDGRGQAETARVGGIARQRSGSNRGSDAARTPRAAPRRSTADPRAIQRRAPYHAAGCAARDAWTFADSERRGTLQGATLWARSTGLSAPSLTRRTSLPFTEPATVCIPARWSFSPKRAIGTSACVRSWDCISESLTLLRRHFGYAPARALADSVEDLRLVTYDTSHRLEALGVFRRFSRKRPDHLKRTTTGKRVRLRVACAGAGGKTPSASRRCDVSYVTSRKSPRYRLAHAPGAVANVSGGASTVRCSRDRTQANVPVARFGEAPRREDADGRWFRKVQRGYDESTKARSNPSRARPPE